MKKKYYYDCPIKALYMMKEFGVNFSEAHGANHADKFFEINETQLCDFATGTIEDFRGIEQIYIAPESEHIFELKEGDLGIKKNLHILEPCFFGGKYWFYESDYLEIRPHPQGVKIIYRNGKNFFNPKEEN